MLLQNLSLIEKWALFGTALVASTIGVYFLIQAMRKFKVVDESNHRSLHEGQKLRGGGIIIVLFFLACLLMFGTNSSFLLALSPALLVALIGFIDDKWGLSAKVRLIFQIMATACFFYFVRDSLPDLNQSRGLIILGITSIFILSFINFFNFMDGIDGIAGSQALVYFFSLVMVGKTLDLYDVEITGIVLCGSAIGFLIFNYSPSKIFMGDVCSTFLGFIMAASAVWMGLNHGLDWGLFIFCGFILFWFDAFTTLIRRMINREQIFQAHRKHLYQRMVLSGKTHQTVSNIYFLLSMISLFSAYLIIYQKIEFMWILLIATWGTYPTMDFLLNSSANFPKEEGKKHS